ncbi:Protein transport protein Sec24A [Orobanche hederae]
MSTVYMIWYGFSVIFDFSAHLYLDQSSLTQPRKMVVSDLDDIFLPSLDELVVNLSESRTLVDTFLYSLPSMFRDNLNVESAFGPALKATAMVMVVGKLLIFQTALPFLGAGRVRLHGDDLRIYGTEKEHELRKPEKENGCR